MARQREPYYFEPCVSVRANRLVFYSKVHGPERHRKAPIKAIKSNDTLTKTASQRLQSTVNLLVSTAKNKKLYSADLKAYFNFRVNFVTLTLPSAQQHTDSQIHNTIFKSFVRYWTTRNPGLLYVYKAEVQNNGNLHYHLTTNSFIHYRKLRNMWNKACNLLGYLDRCKVLDPNSTDVHAVKGIKNLSAYLCKYVGKKDSYTSILVRYHKIYKARLLHYSGDSFKLPKHYFKHLKRKVSIKLWDASKALLIKPISLSAAGSDMVTSIEQAAKFFNKVAIYDYVSIAYLDTLKLPASNLIFKAYFESIKHLVSKSASIKHLLN